MAVHLSVRGDLDMQLVFQKREDMEQMVRQLQRELLETRTHFPFVWYTRRSVREI